MKKNTAVLLAGFGGPTSMAQVRPFLESVLEGVAVPPGRVEEVYRHYEAFGGVSLYPEMTFRQQRALQAELESRGVKVPVFVGFRHSNPGFREFFGEIERLRVQKVIAIVLSPFRSQASFGKYQQKLREAQNGSNNPDVQVVYTGTFHTHPLFIGAQVRAIEQTTKGISPDERARTYFIFLAHSIPIAMSDNSGYASQFLESSSLTVGRLGLSSWMAAYQSRSGNPKEPWLAPDVKDVICAIDINRFQNLVLIPIGFLCDNVEILYDLDQEAKRAATIRRIRYHRTPTIANDPAFIQMLADQILELYG